MITAESPFFPYVLATLLPAIAGILFVVLSKDAARKRIVLPVTLVAFHVAVFLIVFADGRFSGRPAILALVALGLLANALYVGYALRYCETCGATTPRIERAPWRCTSCRKASGTP